MNHIHPLHRISALLFAAACCVTLIAAAPSPPPGPQDFNDPGRGPGPRPPQREPITLTGKILSFNRNPRAGDIEGFILQSADGGLAQINAPFELADQLKKLPTGESVEAAVFPDNGPPNPPQGPPQGPPDGPRRGAGGPPPGGPQDNRPQGPNNQPNHPIFQLISLKDSHGTEFRAPPHPPITVDSTLKAFNYSPRGEVNGLQLANNDFVHLNPQSGNLRLAPNDKVTIEGMALTLPDGSHLIDPQSINGQSTRQGPPPPNGPGRGRGPRGGNQNPGGPGDPNAGPPVP